MFNIICIIKNIIHFILKQELHNGGENMTKPQEDTNKKNKILFVIITLSCLLLPMIIELIINFGESKITYGLKPFFLKIFYTLKEYNSYYATSLTLILGIITLYSQQRKVIEERKIANRLRIRELENKRDFYRPIFTVEEGIESKINVKLLMKSNDLYLEKIKFYSSHIDYVSKERQLKSGDIVESTSKYPFFITAQTLIGETILFCCFSSDKKIYKFLKYDQDPSFPASKEDFYNQKKINSTWKSYNTTIQKHYNNLDPLFYELTTEIRLHLKENHSWLFYSSLPSKTATDFFQNIFNELINRHMFNKTYNDKLFEILKFYMESLINNEKYIEGFNNKETSKKLKNLLKSDFINNKLTIKYDENASLSLELFLKIINQYIYYVQSKNIDTRPDPELVRILSTLHAAFQTVTINSEDLDYNLSNLKIKLFDLTN